MILILVGVVLPWIVIVVAGVIAFRMMGQHGRIMQLLDELGDEVEDLYAEYSKTSLPAGLLAPPFELPDLAGRRTTLEQFRGRRVLLVFFSPDCSFCQEMAPQIAALPWDGADGRPVPVLVSAGDVEKHRAFMEQHDIRCPVLLQEGEEGKVAALYHAEGTPVGYLIDEQGVLISGVAEGADDLLALADPNYVYAPPAPGPQVAGPRVSTPTRAGSDVEGLKVGAQAPAFRLPDLDGGELALENYRGRRLLLVFSDPECKPCDALMPELERLQRAGTGVPVVMVARGAAKANRAKVKQYGLSFPVALQRDWEISRLYRKPGVTPSGYLIDEDGKIAADMAAGGHEILTLFAGRDVAAE